MSAELALLQQIKNKQSSHICEIREFDTPLETFTVNGETWIKNGNYVESAHALAKTVDIGAYSSTFSSANSNVTSIASNENGTIIVATSVAGLSSSTNSGATFTTRATGGTQFFVKVVYGNGIFVAITSTASASTSIYTSTDGITWTARTSVAFTHYDIEFANGVFAITVNTTNVYTSTNGITWTAIATGGVTYFRVKYIKERSLWVFGSAVGLSITSNIIGGIIPQPSTISTQFTSGSSGDIFYFNGYIYTFVQNSTAYYMVRGTGNGIWENYSNANIPLTSSLFVSKILSIDGMLILIANSSPYLFYTADLKNFYTPDNYPFSTVTKCVYENVDGKIWISDTSNFLSKAEKIKGFSLPFDGSKKFMRVS